MATLYLKPALLLYGLVVLGLACGLLAEAQFFTKSSKSIPRMGRRSDQSAPNRYQIYQRALIDSILDQHWPSIFAELESRKPNSELTKAEDGEQVTNNEQPFDLQDYENYLIGSRDERDTPDSRYPISAPNVPPRSLSMKSLLHKPWADELMHSLSSRGEPSSLSRSQSSNEKLGTLIVRAARALSKAKTGDVCKVLHSGSTNRWNLSYTSAATSCLSVTSIGGESSSGTFRDN